METVRILEIKPLSMVTKEGQQRIDLTARCDRPVHLYLNVFRGDTAMIRKQPVALGSGKGTVSVLLKRQEETFDALWQLTDREGCIAAELTAPWTVPRERTFYVMLSSHVDMGLHESHYIQRHETVRTVDLVKDLCDQTRDRQPQDRYRYTMEGTWFWNNYGQDRGEEAAREVVRNYLQTGDMGLCCGIAGNHFQTFGLEELCRSAYERRKLLEKWGLDCRTMAMIDINGIPMSVIGPYAEAGVENLIFAPNHWNPLPSTVWKMDVTREGCYLNPDAGGGGSRIDVRYESALPMVFFWEDEAGRRLLVWASTQYGYGGASIGLFPNRPFVPETVPTMEVCMGNHLPLLDEKYPYDLWLICCYDDNQAPNLSVTDSIAAWNSKWAWPKLRSLGNPDEPFRLLKERYGEQIPVLKGDIAGGWYQHPLTAAELLARKFGADRLLPTAEKWATAAASLNTGYEYPAEEFRRAWDHLLFNDEHSYGVSGYQGRRVYETWMQHRDWIEKAEATANRECEGALEAIAARIAAEEDGYAVFNPTLQTRQEPVETPEGGCILAGIPPLGYRTVKWSQLKALNLEILETEGPPTVENRFYRVKFAQNGAVASIFDKEEGRELLDTANAFRANELVYTRDNHKSFLTPDTAVFAVTRHDHKVTVTVRTRQQELGAELVQEITLQEHEKRIDFDNRILHAKDLVNRKRYYRYLYVAFPFAVDNCRRYCHLNGTVAEYAKDVTGHGTDVYMAVNEWCCAENERGGVALMMLDSQLVEFDHIHPDKTDFGNAGEGSQMFAYVATDWLQMHLPGGSHLDYRFRFSVTSYRGGYREAGIHRMAERYANPVRILPVSGQAGSLDGTACSFLSAEGDCRLTGLKRAEDGDGIIARFYGQGPVSVETCLTPGGTAERVRIDETVLPTDAWESGFATYRIGSGCLRLKERAVLQPRGENGAPAPVGSIYTGLITEPCAAPGEYDGHLYLLWGASMEEDFSHYNLYRSEKSGFTPDESTFLARVEPEEYRVGRYVDMGLKDHTCYYYRVCAVNKQGVSGPVSREFSAFTREPW